MTSIPVQKAKDNRLKLSWAIQEVNQISQFLINLWELSPENRSKMEFELEGLLTLELDEETISKRQLGRLLAYKKSFDFNVEYVIESSWSVDAPTIIDAPVQVTESFVEARDILQEKKAPNEPCPSEIYMDNRYTIGDLYEVAIKASVSGMEVADGAY